MGDVPGSAVWFSDIENSNGSRVMLLPDDLPYTSRACHAIAFCRDDGQLVLTIQDFEDIKRAVSRYVDWKELEGMSSFSSFDALALAKGLERIFQINLRSGIERGIIGKSRAAEFKQVVSFLKLGAFEVAYIG